MQSHCLLISDGHVWGGVLGVSGAISGCIAFRVSGKYQFSFAFLLFGRCSGAALYCGKISLRSSNCCAVTRDWKLNREDSRRPGRVLLLVHHYCCCFLCQNSSDSNYPYPCPYPPFPYPYPDPPPVPLPRPLPPGVAAPPAPTPLLFLLLFLLLLHVYSSSYSYS